MKLLSNARVNSMQAQIAVQALAIKFLEMENEKQAVRIAELETILYSQGVLDKDAVLASDLDKSYYADLVIERCNGGEEE